MLIVLAKVIYDQSFAVVEQEHPTEHVALALITHKLRVAAWITDRNSKVVISYAEIISDAGLRPSEDEDTGLSIMAHFVFRECHSAFRPIEHDP